MSSHRCHSPGTFHSPTLTYECVSAARARLGGPAPPGHLHAVPDGPQRVEGGAHVQDGELVGVLVDVAVVVVDDVAHLLPAAVDDPVVAVERQLVAEEEEEEESTEELNHRDESKKKNVNPDVRARGSSPHPVAEAGPGGVLFGFPAKPL